MGGPMTASSPQELLRQRLCTWQSMSTETGSTVMLILLMCLAIAIVVQGAVGVLLCAERAVAEEAAGRERMAEKDEILMVLRQQVMERWQPIPWTSIGKGEGRVAELPEGGAWLMTAEARQGSTVSRLATTAWIERGRDGIDLPVGALVAQTATAAEGRSLAWVDVDPEDPIVGLGVGDRADCFLRHPPADMVVGAKCSQEVLPDRWRLDPGWLAFCTKTAALHSSVKAAPDASTGSISVAAGPGVIALEGRPGDVEAFPDSGPGVAPDSPLLVVLTGGATLDMRDRGDFYGIIVVDSGSVLLEGTVVHGAVFVSDSVELGAEGQIMFSPSILRWATDRSLNRARLIPGTRSEEMK